MTYDNASVMAAFVGERSIGFPMLRDIDGKHVDAWGIRNEDYGPALLVTVFRIRALSGFPQTALFSPSGRFADTKIEQIGRKC